VIGVPRPYNGGVRYGILADDLTGSCDVAGRLTHLGYRPVVSVRPPEDTKRIPPWPGESSIVVVNTRSRDCPASEAKARVRAAAKLFERNGTPIVYHKIDSTLRGHWAEELAAITRVAHPDTILICPAFPAQGRHIERGKLLLDPEVSLGLLFSFEWMKGESLRERLEKRCAWEAMEIPRKLLRRGARAVREALDAGSKPRCGVFDAYHDGDLAAIGRVVQKLEGRVLCVGSAGLAPHVVPKRATPELADESRSAHPWLLIQGSRRSISHEQFHQLSRARDQHLMSFSPWRGREKRQAWCNEAVDALDLGKDVVIETPEHRDTAAAYSMPSVFERLFRTVLREATLGGVFISGGRTAEAVCDSLRVKALQVTEEVSPGIPTSIALDGRNPGLRFITKAGGFGRPEMVREILEDYIRARR